MTNAVLFDYYSCCTSVFIMKTKQKNDCNILNLGEDFQLSQGPKDWIVPFSLVSHVVPLF